MSLPRLHLVTDAAVLQRAEFLDTARALLRCCGPRCALHLRGHGLPGAALHDIGEVVAAAALRAGAWLIVNDRVDVAMAVRGNGVQLGHRSLAVSDARALLGAGARIGVSAHGTAEVAQAAVDGADFVLLGNIRQTRSHPERRALGVEEIGRAAGAAALPVIAIGGLVAEDSATVARAGAYGMAVISAVWHAADPVEAATEMIAAIDAAWEVQA